MKRNTSKCSLKKANHGLANVTTTSPAVTEPVYIRYGWANSPQCNLFNGEDLPASPFSSMQ